MESKDRLARVLERSMSSLNSPLERLVFLASIRDVYTGHYLHEGWAQVADVQEVHDAAHHMHRAVFSGVIELSLKHLVEELRVHFRTLGGSEQEMAGTWLQAEPFREMMPAGCTIMEREFFVSQMKLALAVIVNSPTSDAPPDSDASPRQLSVPQSPPRRDT